MVGKFTAEMARTVMPGRRTDTFRRTMNAIYTSIERRAKDGFNLMVINGMYYPTKIKQIVDELKENGYRVEYNCMEDILKIMW